MLKKLTVTAAFLAAVSSPLVAQTPSQGAPNIKVYFLGAPEEALSDFHAPIAKRLSDYVNTQATAETKKLLNEKNLVLSVASFFLEDDDRSYSICYAIAGFAHKPPAQKFTRFPAVTHSSYTYLAEGRCDPEETAKQAIKPIAENPQDFLSDIEATSYEKQSGINWKLTPRQGLAFLGENKFSDEEINNLASIASRYRLRDRVEPNQMTMIIFTEKFRPNQKGREMCASLAWIGHIPPSGQMPIWSHNFWARLDYGDSCSTFEAAKRAAQNMASQNFSGKNGLFAMNFADYSFEPGAPKPDLIKIAKIEKALDKTFAEERQREEKSADVLRLRRDAPRFKVARATLSPAPTTASTATASAPSPMGARSAGGLHASMIQSAEIGSGIQTPAGNKTSIESLYLNCGGQTT